MRISVSGDQLAAAVPLLEAFGGSWRARKRGLEFGTLVQLQTILLLLGLVLTKKVDASDKFRQAWISSRRKKKARKLFRSRRAVARILQSSRKEAEKQVRTYMPLIKHLAPIFLQVESEEDSADNGGGGGGGGGGGSSNSKLVGPSEQGPQKVGEEGKSGRKTPEEKKETEKTA